MKRRKNREITPEEQFDRSILAATMYPVFIRVIMILFIGIEAFGCLMPLSLNMSLLSLFCAVLVFLILCPLLFEMRGNRQVRRINMCGYFPVRRKEFAMGKIRIVSEYMSVFWIAVGLIEVITVAFFDMKSFVSSMIAIPVFCVMYTGGLLLAGMAGSKKTEM